MIIGIIGFGMVGRAIHHGFAQICDFKIYDKDKKLSENTLKETLVNSDFIFICVPTPMKKENGEIDLKSLDSTLSYANKYIPREDKILIIKSTIVPGTTDSYIKKYPNLNIIFNPEFLTARTSKLDFINSSRVILGGDPKLTSRVADLYGKRFTHTPIYLTDARTAELVKYTANCFFATKVSFFNEIFDICRKLDIRYEDVRDMTLADGRIGNSHTDVPGHDGLRGFGGLCFPKDLNSMIYKAEELGVDPKVMKAVWEKNIEVREKKDWEKIEGAVSD